MSEHPPRDSIYADPLGQISGFSFDENVVRVFPDMLRRSVPGYNTIITQSGLLAERYAQAGSQLYDLGCSLGATTFSMRQNLHQADCRLIGIDNSEAMVLQCREILKGSPGTTPVDIVLGDIAETPIERASVVAMNFTLQFFSPSMRADLLQRIFDGMLPGGILIISEKIAFDDARQQALHTDMYHHFKRANGYSDLEISQKRTALENVLIPDTLQQHKARLSQAGFSSCEVWFQCFNFVSMVALK